MNAEDPLPSDQQRDWSIIMEIARNYFSKSEQVKISVVPTPGAVSVAVFATDLQETVFLKLSSLEKGDQGMSEYSKEKWCLERAAELAIPSPQVLRIGTRKNRAFLILSRIVGISATLMKTEDEKGLAWRTLGCYARAFHQIQPHCDHADDSSVLLMIPGAKGFSWTNYVNYNLLALENSSDPLLTMAVYSASELPFLSAVFRGLRELPLTIGLCHGDLSLRNCIIDQQQNNQKVYLFDWGCAEFQAVPHYDILSADFQDESDEREFFTGYGLAEHERRKISSEVKAMKLLKAFDLVRWAIDKKPDRIEHYASKARSAKECFFQENKALD